MRKIIHTLLGLFLSTTAFAQWSGTSPIYYHGGNVGIGTANPGKLLTLNSASNVYLRISKSAYPDYFDLGITSHTADFSYTAGTSTNSNFRFLTNGTTRMYIQHSGRVGLGTEDPKYKLHVEGNTYTKGLFSSGAIHIYSTQADNTNKRVSINTLVGSSAYIYNYDEVDQTFHTLNFGGTHSLVSGITVLGNGKVGIGNSNPSNELEVNGTIRSKKVKVEASPWPDYVFSDEYELRGLEELESFIQQNGHLPEVPSEQEVKTTGQDLGQVQAVLLKKIEELTLYLIEEQKQRKKLENELKALKKQIDNNK